MTKNLPVIEVTPLWEMEAANVGVFGDAVHREVLPPAAQDDPFPGLRGEPVGLWEGDEADPGLWVPRV